ncbi:MAG: eL32 family ribosomal protein [Nanoarchaeota archaeon]|nr:eL32 family ribosomal protein [Nanoarchaeota archaeon]
MKFLRRAWQNTSATGRGRKKKQVWRRPTGRHNKMRDNKRGKPATVNVGYRSDKKFREKINEQNSIQINNLKDLEKAGKDQILVIGKIGKKKKLEILKKVKEKGLQIFNVNSNKFIKKHARKMERKNKTKKTDEKNIKDVLKKDEVKDSGEKK